MLYKNNNYDEEDSFESYEVDFRNIRREAMLLVHHLNFVWRIKYVFVVIIMLVRKYRL